MQPPPPPVLLQVYAGFISGGFWRGGIGGTCPPGKPREGDAPPLDVNLQGEIFIRGNKNKYVVVLTQILAYFCIKINSIFLTEICNANKITMEIFTNSF